MEALPDPTDDFRLFGMFLMNIHGQCNCIFVAGNPKSLVNIAKAAALPS
jgi:hypothetical protein